MDMLDLFRVLKKRWKASASAFAALMVTLVAVMVLVPQQDQAQWIGLIVPTNNPEVQNPYGNVNNSQSQMAALVVTVLKAPATIRELTAAGATGTIEVTNGNDALDTQSPFVKVTVTAATANAARSTANLYQTRAKTEMSNRQDAAKVSDDQRLVISDVLSPNDITTTRSAQLRAVGLVGAVGLVLAVLSVIVFDRAANKKESRETVAKEGKTARSSGSKPSVKTPKPAEPVAVPEDEWYDDYDDEWEDDPYSPEPVNVQPAVNTQPGKPVDSNNDYFSYLRDEKPVAQPAPPARQPMPMTPPPMTPPNNGRPDGPPWQRNGSVPPRPPVQPPLSGPPSNPPRPPVANGGPVRRAQPPIGAPTSKINAVSDRTPPPVPPVRNQPPRNPEPKKP